MKQRVRKRKFAKRQAGAKLKKDIILKKQRVEHKFNKLKKKIDKENELKKNPPVVQVLTPFFSTPQKKI